MDCDWVGDVRYTRKNTDDSEADMKLKSQFNH